MALFGQGDLPIISQARHGFARRGPRQSDPPAPGQPGHQRALHQALGIDDDIVVTAAQLAEEVRDIAAGGCRLSPPPPHGHWNHGIHGRMPCGNGRESFLDDPVERQVGDRSRRVRYRR